MILNISEAEETAQTSPQALSVFTDRSRSLSRSPGDVGSGKAEGELFYDELIFKEMGYLYEDGTFTPLGFDIATQLRTATHQLRIRHLHAHSTNIFDLYCGQDFDIVFASINDRGRSTGQHIFSRTVPASSLHHLLAWVSAPALNIQTPAEPQLKLPVDFLDSPELISRHGVMWEVSSSISPEILIFGLYNDALWLLDSFEGDSKAATAVFEHHDALTINLMLHRLWAQIHGFKELL